MVLPHLISPPQGPKLMNINLEVILIPNKTLIMITDGDRPNIDSFFPFKTMANSVYAYHMMWFSFNMYQ